MRHIVAILAGLIPLLFGLPVNTVEGLVACGACVFTANALYSILAGKE